MVVFRIFGMALLSSLAAVPAAAGGDGPVRDAIAALMQIRYIKEGDPGITTSKCIGNPVTPLCAVETARASIVYRADHLLEIARGERPGTTTLITPPPYNPNIFCYRVVGYWHYRKGDLAMRKADFIKPGDVAIQVRWGILTKLGVRISDECDFQYFDHPKYRSYLTRKGKYGWYVVLDHHVIDYVRAPGYYPGQEKASREKLK